MALALMEKDMNKNTGESTEEEEGEKDEYVVEKILGKQDIDGSPFYWIKWKGWSETANTWEPVEHLGGCPELLKAFEKEYAAKMSVRKKKKPVSRRRRPSSSKGQSHPSTSAGSGSSTKQRYSFDLSENEDADSIISRTQNNMQSYGINEEWPMDKEPLSMEGVIIVDDVLTYVVKRKVRGVQLEHLDRTNTILVHSTGFRYKFPELVIAYYEKRLLWGDDPKSDQEKAEVAAQISLLMKNKASRLGNKVANDVDQLIQNESKTETETVVIDTENNPEDPGTGTNDQISTTSMPEEVEEMETQNEDITSTIENENNLSNAETQLMEVEPVEVETAPEVVDVGDSADETDPEVVDMEDSEDGVDTEVDESMSNSSEKENDQFGLPKNINESFSSDSDAEIEEVKDFK